MHGGPGILYFSGSHIRYSEIKSLPKKKKLKKITVLSCSGGAGSNSVAKGFYLATEKNAKTYACIDSVCYRTETRGRRVVYCPRYSKKYIDEYNRKHKKKISFLTNPIKKFFPK